MKVLGLKPFWGISHHERLLHVGLAPYWYSGEWFDFSGDDDARDYFVDGFRGFSNDNPDQNSVDFIYWYNEGMAEFSIEMHRQGQTLPRFQKQESGTQKG
jgi:hypothetical protein